jgi:hypothetical protein
MLQHVRMDVKPQASTLDGTVAAMLKRFKSY